MIFLLKWHAKINIGSPSTGLSWDWSILIFQTILFLDQRKGFFFKFITDFSVEKNVKQNPQNWNRLALISIQQCIVATSRLLLLLLSHFSRVWLCVIPQTAATRLPRPWCSPGKNTGVGCHFLLQCMKVKSESEVAQWCPTLRDPMDCSLPGSSVHGICQARVLEATQAEDSCRATGKRWW